MTAAQSPPLEKLRDALSGRPALEIVDSMAQAVREAGSFVIAAHVNPDGDSLGSSTALGLALVRLGKKVRVVVSETPPEKFRPFLPAGLPEIIPEKDAAGRLGPADLCILLDTSEPERAGIFKDLFFAPGQGRVCLDHHACHARGLFDHQLVLMEAPATGSLVLALIDRLDVPLTPAIAQALWMAIATDTGWFRFENTSSWALADASRLAAVGVDIPRLYRRLYEEYTPSRARLLGGVLARFESGLDGAFVWSCTSRRELEAQGLALGDLDGVVDHLKAIRGVRVAALIVETDPGKYKISLRATGNEPGDDRSPGDGAPGDRPPLGALEVESIARRLGGGGHAKAAGCRFSGTREELIATLTSAVREKLGQGAA